MLQPHQTPSQESHAPTQSCLLDGCFSSLSRSLALWWSGSCTSAAIRRAPLDAWSLSGDGHTIEMRASDVQLRISLGDRGPVSITAATPGGNLDLHAEHPAAQRILRRIDRRLRGYTLGLRKEAAAAFREIAPNVSHDESLCWYDARKFGLLLPRFAMAGRSYVCHTKGGFIARVSGDVVAGTISMESSYSDNMRYQQQVESASRNGEWHVIPGIMPPLASGPFQSSRISVELFHEKLSRISSLLGFGERVILERSAYGNRDSELVGIWRQAKNSPSEHKTAPERHLRLQQ